jgi:ATP-dependent Clp protease ATP-binding subunit ClpC
LPDKAIDALDEAGSRVHITNIEVKILDLERQLEDIQGKECCQKKQNMRPAKLRMMKTHRKELAIAQEQWEEDAKNNQLKSLKTMLQMCR